MQNRVTKRIPMAVEGGWRFTRTISFLAEPVTLEVALAHRALDSRAVIVVAARGPRGGWPGIRYYIDTIPLKLGKDENCYLV